MAPREAAAKLLAASLGASFGLCYPSVPQQMAMLSSAWPGKWPVFSHGLSVVYLCIELFLFTPQTPVNFKTLSNSPVVN